MNVYIAYIYIQYIRIYAYIYIYAHVVSWPPTHEGIGISNLGLPALAEVLRHVHRVPRSEGPGACQWISAQSCQKHIVKEYTLDQYGYRYIHV